jgi:hypothetical protein
MWDIIFKYNLIEIAVLYLQNYIVSLCKYNYRIIYALCIVWTCKLQFLVCLRYVTFFFK